MVCLEPAIECCVQRPPSTVKTPSMYFYLSRSPREIVSALVTPVRAITSRESPRMVN